MVAGPGLVGTAIAHAGLLGIGPDIDFLDPCGHGDKKSDAHHPRPGSEVSGQSSRSTASVTAAEAPTARVSSVSQSVEAPQALSAGDNTAVANNPEMRSLASVPGNVAVAEGVSGGGGGVPRGLAGRVGLPPVSTAPSTRSVVIRGTQGGAARAPEFAPTTIAEGPVVALAAPPPVLPEPNGQPAPEAPPVPSPATPPANEPLTPGITGVIRVPDSYRTGYAEYLRSASTSDLLVAALPGAAGIAGFTLIGAFAGYRQARGLQKALQAPVPTRVLM
jgi:hypothetical protein